MNQGIVKWYDDTKGYGFIVMSDGKDIFVHYSALRGGITILNKGDKVEFEIKEELQAHNVVKVLN